MCSRGVFAAGAWGFSARRTCSYDRQMDDQPYVMSPEARAALAQAPKSYDHGWFTPEQVIEWVDRSRQAQGLPFHVKDPDVLDKVATIINASRARREDART